MREALAEMDGCRKRFSGTFARFGTKRSYKFPLTTILLRDIKDQQSGKIVTDHMWFTVGVQLSRLSLKPTDVISFDARITTYAKGYQGRRGREDWDDDEVSVGRSLCIIFTDEGPW